MVTLDQVEQLELKVKQVVAIVEELRAENARLLMERKQLESDFDVLKERYEASNSKAGALEGAQQIVEKGIMEAIDMLEEARKAPDIQESSDDALATPYIVPQESEENHSNHS